MRELIAISRAKGPACPRRTSTRGTAPSSAFRPRLKTSMLQDVEAGRKTEVEAFAGTVIALGEPDQRAYAREPSSSSTCCGR
jgi:2-dehydropantoate 2-reductase